MLENGVQSPLFKRDYILDTAFKTAFFLLLFMVMTAIAAVVTFLFNLPLTRWQFPLALLGTSAIVYAFSRFDKKTKGIADFIPIGLGIIGVIGAAFICNFFVAEVFHDALMYHVAAVIGMLQGWNPIKSVFTDSGAHAVWINHLPKASWYYSAVVSSFFGAVRFGKSYHMVGALALTLTMISVFCRTGTGKNLYMRLFVCIVTGLNPIFITQCISHYNDSLMGSVILCLIMTLLAIDLDVFSLKNPFVAGTIAVSIALCINYKFSGIAFAALFCGVFLIKWLYQAIQQHQFGKVTGIIIAGVLGLGLGAFVGINPYFTNLFRGFNVVYPMVGYTPPAHGFYAFPLVDDTPPEYVGMPNPIRFLNSIYSATQLEHPILKAPWDFHLLGKEMAEASLLSRFGAFGPLFALVFTLALVSIAIIICNRKLNRESKSILLTIAIILFAGMILRSTWIARLYPMAWAIPTLAVLLLWTDNQTSPLKNYLSDLLSLLILVNITVMTYASHVDKYAITNRVFNSVVNCENGDSCLVQVVRPCFPYAVRYLLAEKGCKVHLVNHLDDNEWLRFSFKVKAYNSKEHNPEIDHLIQSEQAK